MSLCLECRLTRHASSARALYSYRPTRAARRPLGRDSNGRSADAGSDGDDEGAEGDESIYTAMKDDDDGINVTVKELFVTYTFRLGVFITAAQLLYTVYTL